MARSQNSKAGDNGGPARGRALLAVTRFRTSVVTAAGWRRRGVAAGLGVLAAGALPPLHVVILLIPAFVGLLWMIDSAPHPRAALAVGWWFGLGHFVAGFYWIAFALLVFPDRYGWLAPIAVLGIAGVVAVFPALAAMAVRAANCRGPGRVLVLAAAWAALEWVRGWAFTGFPWNLLGSAWMFSDAMVQLAAVTGVYGLSLLTVAAAAMPAVLTDGGLDRRRKRRPVIAAFAVLGLVWAAGGARLAGAADAVTPGVWLRLVQPNIPQALKWRRELRRGHVALQLKLSRAPGDAPGPPPKTPTHVIWGETAVPYFLAREPDLRSVLGRAVPRGGLIITGAPRAGPGPDGRPRVWNSLHAIDASGRVAGTYDKAHLVPFGEYVPFRSVLRFSKITAGRQDFSPGPGVRTLRLPGLPPVSPLICYEGIFPGQVAGRRDRPQWLLNVTNDGWYGNSAGPYQHFAAARMRAVEEGLPLVRVANTGISGIVDGYGRVVVRLGLGRQGAVDGPLPRALESRTLYGRLGDWVVGWIVLSVLAAGLAMGRREYR